MCASKHAALSHKAALDMFFSEQPCLRPCTRMNACSKARRTPAAIPDSAKLLEGVAGTLSLDPPICMDACMCGVHYLVCNACCASANILVGVQCLRCFCVMLCNLLQVAFLRAQLGAAAVPCPALNIGSSWAAIVNASLGNQAISSYSFSPYTSDLDFLFGTLVGTVPMPQSLASTLHVPSLHSPGPLPL